MLTAQGLVLVILMYGCLNGLAVNFVNVSLSVLPVTWYPERRGLVLGVVMAAYGLSSTVMAPLQTFIINPGKQNN